jgi:hypothetical protein
MPDEHSVPNPDGAPDWVAAHIAAGLLAIPAGGFGYGFVMCQDCGFDVLSRGFVGLIHMIQTTFGLGCVPMGDTGDDDFANLWAVAIAPAFRSLCALFWQVDFIRRRSW